MNVALYIRVSSDEQARHGLSVSEQRTTLLNYAEENNYTVVDVYADEGVSASKQPHRRHEFQRMLRDCKNGLIEKIVFLKLDRWFRSVRDYYRTQDILDECNVTWECVTEDYDTTTRAGKLNLNIRLAIAEDEAANASERVKFIFNGKLNRKEAITGMQPFGYKIENKMIVKDPETEKEVEDMFRYFFSCLSGYETYKYLEAKYGYGVSYNTIRRRLKNPAYTGAYKDIPNYRPAYITQEQYELILRIFSQNTRTAQNNKTYIFNGLCICPECGHRMNSCTLNKRHKAYRCKYHFEGLCDFKKAPHEKTIESHLLADLQCKIGKFAVNVQNSKKYTKNFDTSKLEKQLDRLNNVYIMGNISDAEYQKKTAEIKRQIAEMKKPSTAPVVPAEVSEMLSDKSFADIYNSLSDKEKHALWHSVIDHIEFDMDGNITEIFYIH